MNKMHTLAKIILSAIAIFFTLRLLSQLPMLFFWFYSKPSWETAATSFFSLLLTAGAIAAMLYLFIYKRESLAKKIVGPEQFPEPGSQIQWLPVALRLICITGGIYFLSSVLWRATHVINQLAVFKATNAPGYTSFYTRAPFNPGSLLPWLIMLTIGIYLLCGAPHFVRWQVKKTLEECKQQIGLKENQ